MADCVISASGLVLIVLRRLHVIWGEMYNDWLEIGVQG